MKICLIFLGKERAHNTVGPVWRDSETLVKIEDTYLMIWCTDFCGASLGVAKTKDFKHFVRIEDPFLPFRL